MKTKNIFASLLAVAALVALPACSDDEYTPGEQSPGVYFPVDDPEEYELALDGEEFTVTVARQGLSDAATYTMTTVDYDNTIFTVPGTVTFAEGASTAELVIKYDASKLEYEERHAFTLAFGDGTSTYGAQTYEFVALLPAPWTEWESMGKGTYTYASAILSGDDPGLEIERRENEITKAVQFRIPEWIQLDESGEEFVPLVIDGVPAGQGNYICYVHPFHAVDVSQGQFWFADVYSYVTEVDPVTIGATPAQVEGTSYYIAEEGRFYLYMVGYIPESGAASADDAGPYSLEYEFFQLDGYNDYSIELKYSGVYTDAATDDRSAVLSATVGTDVEEVRVALVEGTLKDTLAGLIDGSVDYVTANASNASKIFLPVSDAGDYTAVGAVIADNEVKQYATVKFTVEIAADGDWKTLGEVEFLSGWIIPSYVYEDGNTRVMPEDYPLYCNVQESVKNPGYYRLVDPYKDEKFMQQFQLSNVTKGYINIDATDLDFINIPASFTGVKLTNGDYYASDLVYYFSQEHTKEEIIEAGANVNYYDASYDAYIIPEPIYGWAEDKIGYYYPEDPNDRNSPAIAASEIYMPIDANSPRKAISRAINSRIKSVQIIKHIENPIPVQKIISTNKLGRPMKTATIQKNLVNLSKFRKF